MNARGQPLKLLLVDDEPEFRRATASALERRNFKVAEAGGGMEALQIIERESFDIVLLDLKMPGMTGIETLAKIRERAQKLPVIILSGHGSFDNALAGINLEIVDFLQKPVEMEVLVARINRFLMGKTAIALRERTIRELMTPPDKYPKLYLNQPVEEAVQKMMAVFFPQGREKSPLPPLRSALVYSRDEYFLGMLRFPDLLKLVMPPSLLESFDREFYPGMFLAQCKLIGQRSIWELMSKPVSVEVEAPLMEAVSLMIEHHLINLPVFEGGKLVGVLRERDIILEIAKNMGMV